MLLYVFDYIKRHIYNENRLPNKNIENMESGMQIINSGQEAKGPIDPEKNESKSVINRESSHRIQYPCIVVDKIVQRNINSLENVKELESMVNLTTKRVLEIHQYGDELKEHAYSVQKKIANICKEMNLS